MLSHNEFQFSLLIEIFHKGVVHYVGRYILWIYFMDMIIGQEEV